MFTPSPLVPHQSATALRSTDTDPSVTHLDPQMEQAVSVFLAERTRLFRIAHRIVGDVAGAEDVVQEAWLRWQRCDRTQIENPGAFLTTAATHLAINVVQSARRRHETPTAVPLVDLVDRSADPTRQVDRAAAVEQAVGLLMARLTPAEMAAYLLRKGFDYPYQMIARVLRTTSPNARQLVRRARCGLARTQLRRVDPDTHRLVVRAFVAAARTGVITELERVLADVVRAARLCKEASASPQRLSGGPGVGGARPSKAAASPHRMSRTQPAVGRI